MNKKMNKKNFICALAKIGGFRKKVAEGVYDVFIKTLKHIICSEGGRINLAELGTFEVKTRVEKKWVNPATGESLLIPERRVLTFKASKKILDRLNKKWAI